MKELGLFSASDSASACNSLVEIMKGSMYDMGVKRNDIKLCFFPRFETFL